MMGEETCSQPSPQIVVLRVKQSSDLVPPCIRIRLEGLLEYRADSGGEIACMPTVVQQNAIFRKCHWISVWHARERQAVIASKHGWRTSRQRIKRLRRRG